MVATFTRKLISGWPGSIRWQGRWQGKTLSKAGKGNPRGPFVHFKRASSLSWGRWIQAIRQAPGHACKRRTLLNILNGTNMTRTVWMGTFASGGFLSVKAQALAKGLGSTSKDKPPTTPTTGCMPHWKVTVMHLSTSKPKRGAWLGGMWPGRGNDFQQKRLRRIRTSPPSPFG